MKFAHKIAKCKKIMEIKNFLGNLNDIFYYFYYFESRKIFYNNLEININFIKNIIIINQNYYQIQSIEFL